MTERRARYKRIRTELEYKRTYIAASPQKRCLPNSNTPPQAREASQCPKPPHENHPESRAPPATKEGMSAKRTSRPEKEISCAPEAAIARSVHKPPQRAEPAPHCLVMAHMAVRLVCEFRCRSSDWELPLVLHSLRQCQPHSGSRWASTRSRAHPGVAAHRQRSPNCDIARPKRSSDLPESPSPKIAAYMHLRRRGLVKDSTRVPCRSSYRRICRQQWAAICRGAIPRHSPRKLPGCFTRNHLGRVCVEINDKSIEIEALNERIE